MAESVERLDALNPTAVIATIGCFALAVFQNRVAKASGSPLVEVDARNWTLDGFRAPERWWFES